jgi:hypothetical protein
MRPWLVGALIVVLVAGLAAWMLSAYERVPSKEWVGPSGEARVNPFLAAERLASRMGVQARTLRSLPELDRLEDGAVLLLPNGRQAIDPPRLKAILAWVEVGGHLIAEAELAGVPDPLFEALGIERVSGPGTSPPKLRLADGRELAVTMSTRLGLRLPDKEPWLRLGTAQAASLLSFRHGQGNVTAAADLDFARNDAIGKLDHAEALWHLIALAPAGTLRVFLRPQRLSLCGFLREHAASTLAAGAVLLLLWLWRVAPRFGPLAPDAPAARRRLVDHLRASGRYCWANGRRGRLVEAAREAALRRIARVQPDFNAAPHEERVARLAALIGTSPQDAERFLIARGEVRGLEFVGIMHAAQRIHSAMKKGRP